MKLSANGVDLPGKVAVILREKRPLWSKPDVELMTTDIIVTDYL